MSGSSTKTADTPAEDAPEAPAETKETTSATVGNEDLEMLAPIQNEPTVYGPGMTVYKGTIVFTVEIRDDSAKADDADKNSKEPTEP